MNEKRKKIMKIIIAIVALAMIVSTFAGIFGNRSAKTENQTKVTKDSISEKDKKAINDTLSKDVPQDVKKDMQNAKVQVSGNAVNGVIVLSQQLNKIQSDKVAEEYAKTLTDKYKGKDINVKVVYKNQDVAKVNSSSVTLAKNIPSAIIKISSGITEMDRYVSVKLNTDKPQEYSVEVGGKKLEYFAEGKYFDGVVEKTDEAQIKKSIKVMPIKK